MTNNPVTPSERRSFLNRLNAGGAALAGLALGRVAQAQSKSAVKFEPTRYDKDDWLEIPSKNRFLLDTNKAEGVGNALLWGANYIRTSQTEYGLQPSDLAFIIVVRHRSVSFGYNDAMWAKYGEAISKQLNFVDPKTKEAPKTNVFNYGEEGSPRGNFESMSKSGIHVAVCATATRGMATSLAKATNQDVDAVFKELTSNLVKGGRMVPAGIMTVARAIEHGYATVATS
jgi:intracellular sulfur oxidation DsrE/DsrF family protein